MTDIRDTKFQGFANLVVTEIMATNAMDSVDATRFLNDDEIIELQTLIAQRAYDLAVHVLTEQPIIPRNTFPDDSEIIAKIPDLTAWPPTE